MVGVVEALGPGVQTPRAGSLVAALTVHGGQASHLCWPAADLVEVPATVDPGEAVALVMDWVVADQLIHRVARLRAGQIALVHGAAGSVGSALVQLCIRDGIRVFGTASAAKHGIIRSLGGIPIDYRTEDFVAAVQAATQGHGVQAVFDGIGGPVTTRSLRALRRGGTLAVFGLTGLLDSSGRRSSRRTTQTLWAYARVFASAALRGRRARLYSIQRLARRHPDWYRADLTRLFRLLDAGQIHPLIADRITLAEVPRAHERLAHGAVTGKIIVQPGR